MENAVLASLNASTDLCEAPELCTKSDPAQMPEGPNERTKADQAAYKNLTNVLGLVRATLCSTRNDAG